MNIDYGRHVKEGIVINVWQGMDSKEERNMGKKCNSFHGGQR